MAEVNESCVVNWGVWLRHMIRGRLGLLIEKALGFADFFGLGLTSESQAVGQGDQALVIDRR